MHIVESGKRYRIFNNAITTYDQLPPKTYRVDYDPETRIFSLLEAHDFEIPETKIYGQHLDKVKKVLNSMDKMNRNLGVILSGDKGIGKSLFSKCLGLKARKKGIPVILVNEYHEGIANFLEEIEQTVMILFDEYDKTFDEKKHNCTAIKCSNLVILSGLSGTGKSALVEIYARALGIRNNLEDDRLLFVPVRPSWNDDADLLGYVDLVHNVYRPSDTGFVDFLVNAQKEENKGKLFIVCFDEMNLARVEHYFSQFLSLLERPENQRELQLYDSQYAGQLYNSATYPSKIIIGDNIRFIGTVNIDESTYHFSDKVLDRANVIELDVLDYSKEWTKKQYASLITPTWSKDEYDALINKDVDIKADKVQELLWEIHQLLQSASAKYGVGPRIVKAIKMYINNLPKTEINGFNKGVALDYQIAQRILTKVRGPEIQIGRLLNGKSNTGFNQIFDKYSELSDFKKCRKVISEKQKELGAYGYCI